MKKNNILKISIFFTIPAFTVFFFVNFFQENYFFTLKNIIAIILCCLLNLIAGFFEVYICHTNTQKKMNNKNEPTIFSNRKKLIIIFFSIFLLSFIFLNYLYFSGFLIIFPDQVGVVNDYSNILSDEETIELSNLIKKFMNKEGFRTIIAITDNIKIYKNPMKFFTDLGSFWWNRSFEDIVLIGYCIKCGYICILPSKNLSGILTSEILDHTIRNILIPEFHKNSNYFGGFKKAIIDIYSVYEAID